MNRLHRQAAGQWVGLAVVVLIALTAGGPVLSGPGSASAPGQKVVLTGYFTDEWCGKSNANPEGAECARRCAEKGSAMALYADGKLYKIVAADKQTAVDNVGVEVEVLAQPLRDGTIAISSVKRTAASAP